MKTFESLLSENRAAVERFVRGRLPNFADSEDVVQEICLRALTKFDTLRDEAHFRAWLFAIARSCCADYFRLRGESVLPLESVRLAVRGNMRISSSTPVSEALERLEPSERELLRLLYWRELSQREIAERLGIPVGTVKSRLYAAKRRFREAYGMRGDLKMKKGLPEFLPEYKIEAMSEPPFEVRCEELPGWMIIPRLNERLTWGLYEQPGGRRTEYCECEVLGRIAIHGEEGVELRAVQYDSEDYYRTGSIDRLERLFAAQVSETRVRFLAESHVEDGIRRVFTFLDGAEFHENWGCGEDNLGAEVLLRPRGRLSRSGNMISGAGVDIVGRYRVTLGGTSYDTVCLIDAECFNDAILSEQFIDSSGRTVLWRRFNRDDWGFSRYGRAWSSLLPSNERLYLNGALYVHWYDCVSNYVL